MTQKATVLAMLQAGPVCGTRFLEAYIPRYSARILELRQDGQRIETGRCRDWTHGHRTAQALFTLQTGTQERLPI